MTRRKKLLLGFVVLVLLSQVPFAYRRYQLGRLHSAIQQVNFERSTAPTDTGFVDYVGVLHVHSFLGGHTTGSFEDIIAAAKINQLDFVVMTEHLSGHFNTAAMTLKGKLGGVLFVNGNEVTSGDSDRLLVIPGDESDNSQTSLSTSELIAKAKSRGALALVAYPQEFKSWPLVGYDGLEVYNVYTNARQINPAVMFFDSLWSYRSYPDLLFATFYSRPTKELQKWDELISSGQKSVAVAGNDAHANIGVSLNDAAGQTLAGIKLDPYDRSFRLVRVHVLIQNDKPLTSESLLEALGLGHSFIGFDLFCQTAGFSFSATNGKENKIQGDEIALEKEVQLSVSVPVSSRVILFKDGRTLNDDAGIKRKEYVVAERGSYRVEVYLPQLPKPVSDQPWIISNPIYVR